MTKNYKCNDTSMLAEHFSVSEFRCKCGSTHDTIINSELPEKLERLFKALSITVVKSEISNDKQKQSVDALISILYIEFGKGNQKLLYIRNRL